MFVFFKKAIMKLIHIGINDLRSIFEHI